MPYIQSSITDTIRGLIVPIYAPSVLAAIARGGALIALPLFALEIGGGPALAAGVVGLRAAGTMAANLPSGYFASKFGDKVVMLAGLAILVAALGVLTGYASEVTLLISSFVLGIGSGSWIMARLLHITETVRLEQRGRVISVLAGIERGGHAGWPRVGGRCHSDAWISSRLCECRCSVPSCPFGGSVEDNQSACATRNP